MSEREQVVDEGRVWCAVRSKDVNVDTCFPCYRCRRVDLDSAHPTVTCDVDSVDDLFFRAVGPSSP